MKSLKTGAPRRRLLVAAALPAAAVLLAACTAGSTSGHATTSSSAVGATSSAVSTPTPTTSAPAGPAVITTSWTSTAKHSPSDPFTVDVASGTLTSVTMTNPSGKVVTGTISSDGSSWHTTEDLGYSKTYSIVANAVNADGVAVQKKTTLTTVTPDNQTMPYMQRLGGYTLTNGATYGVAIVPVVHFDEPITDEAAAEKALTVTTVPAVQGSWDWIDDQNVHYRPENYWPSGTKVTITADVYGKDLGHGLYGQADVSSSFTIGRKQVTVAYDSAPKVDKVYVYDAAGKVIKTMNTSMGKHSGETVDGNYINFYTLNGTYTVLDHEQPAKMCSASYGLPADAPGGYACEDIYNATKISTDGIYLHELLTTIYAQNNGYDVSHGCLNLDASNSLWFFDHSMIGDPVEIHAAKGAPELQEWEGGDWSIPWSTWVKGSALS